MVLRKYGLELHSLHKNDLELIRMWRNDEFVRDHMFFQSQISAEDQKKWFAQLGTANVYLTINYASSKIGVINVKDIDWTSRSGEAGIFIGVAAFRNSFVPMLAIYALMDVFFEELNFSSLRAKVRADNASGLAFNQELGYQIVAKDEREIQLYIDQAMYFEQKQKRKPFFEKFATQETHTFSEDEKNYLFLRK